MKDPLWSIFNFFKFSVSDLCQYFTQLVLPSPRDPPQGVGPIRFEADSPLVVFWTGFYQFCSSSRNQ